jgi:hypothetical protein
MSAKGAARSHGSRLSSPENSKTPRPARKVDVALVQLENGAAIPITMSSGSGHTVRRAAAGIDEGGIARAVDNLLGNETLNVGPELCTVFGRRPNRIFANMPINVALRNSGILLRVFACQTKTSSPSWPKCRR